MEFITNIFDFIKPGIPLFIALILGLAALAGLRRLLEKRYEGEADKNMRLQAIMLLLSFVVLVVVIIVSPMNDSQKGQILSLVGIVLSAAIALSSTTFVGNIMAGLMLRTVKGFKVGDFISVGDSFGRVSERGLFHIEIQTEQRDLITLPNLHLVTNPVKVIRPSGTIVCAEVSLGYDLPRTRVKEVLLAAAEKCGLSEPFVHVIELKDYSVVYRLSGLLSETKQLLTARSKIREGMLDALHAAKMEIVSPTFMNTRQLPIDLKFIPKVNHDDDQTDSTIKPEEIVFDKAEEAVSVEQLRQRFENFGTEIKGLEKSLKETASADEKSRLEAQLERLKKSREAVGERLNREIEKAHGEEH